MTTKEKLNRLLAIIGELTEFYGELSGELPPLRFVGADAPANSEVKKMRWGGFCNSPASSRR